MSINTFPPSVFLCGQSYIFHKENWVMVIGLFLVVTKDNNVDDFEDIFPSSSVAMMK